MRLLCLALISMGLFAQKSQTGQFFRFQVMQLDVDFEDDRFVPLVPDGLNFDQDITIVEDGDDSDTGFMVSDVILVHPNFGFEVGALYLGNYTFFFDGPERQYKVVQDFKSLQGGLFGTYSWKRFSGFLRAGVNYFWDEAEWVDLHPLEEPVVDNPLTYWEEKSTDSYFGAGLSYRFDDRWGIEISLDKINLDKVSMNGQSVSIRYHW